MKTHVLVSNPRPCYKSDFFFNERARWLNFIADRRILLRRYVYYILIVGCLLHISRLAVVFLRILFLLQ